MQRFTENVKRSVKKSWGGFSTAHFECHDEGYQPRHGFRMSRCDNTGEQKEKHKHWHIHQAASFEF
jgi:hypothetical protein